MKYSLQATSLLGLTTAASWPNGPLTTSGSSIIDASGNNVIYAGANWPGAADVMIPEGLQYQSVATIVAKLAEAGMNAIRLTYAIELIDQIYENGGVDVPVLTAFVEALGEENGTAVFQQVLAANPAFSEDITRLEVSDNGGGKRRRRVLEVFRAADMFNRCLGLRCHCSRGCCQRDLHPSG